ncbi:vesicle transport protein GOT1B-like [Hordeum vulgare]|nr:vesicle transport protein GOT1B-like [Hordeum vulgare]
MGMPKFSFSHGGASELQDFACSSPPVPSKMVSFEMNDLKKIGLGLTGFGVFFSFLGIVFFFDKGLIAMGNILFLSGLGLTIGLKSTMQFFTKPKNYKWILANSCGFPAKDSYPWLDFFNSHLSHRSLTVTEGNECRCSILPHHGSYDVAAEVFSFPGDNSK